MSAPRSATVFKASIRFTPFAELRPGEQLIKEGKLADGRRYMLTHAEGTLFLTCEGRPASSIEAHHVAAGIDPWYDSRFLKGGDPQ